MSETTNKPTVYKGLTGYWYCTRQKPTPNGKAMQVVGRHTDVTESVEKIVEQEICAFLAYLAETHSLELLDPNPVEEDGQKYLHGLAEKTGRKYVNEVIADWRKA